MLKANSPSAISQQIASPARPSSSVAERPASHATTRRRLICPVNGFVHGKRDELRARVSVRTQRSQHAGRERPGFVRQRPVLRRAPRRPI